MLIPGPVNVSLIAERLHEMRLTPQEYAAKYHTDVLTKLMRGIKPKRFDKIAETADNLGLKITDIFPPIREQGRGGRRVIQASGRWAREAK